MATLRDRLRERMERYRKVMGDLPDERLAEVAAMASEDAAFYKGLADAANGEALRRMAARGASLLVTGAWMGEKRATRSYVWDVEMLRDNVQPNVPPEMWDDVCQIVPPPPPPPPRVEISTQKMLALGRKLGLTLEPFYRVEERNPKVEWKPRQEDKPL